MSAALVAIFLTVFAWAEFEWPRELVPVKLNNRLIGVSWRDGRPIAQRREVYMFLGISKKGDPDIDLATELERVKAKITTKPDGSIDVDPGQAQRFKEEFEEQERAKGMAPRLVASGFRYVADTE